MEKRVGRSISIIVALALVASAPGCGSGGRYPVTGSVSYRGKPAAGAAVHFHREGAAAEEATTFPIGIVDTDGNYQLEVPGVGSGAIPGKYKVLVLWQPEKDPNTPVVGKSSAKGRKDPKSDTDRFQFRYFHLDKPLLTAEVKPEVNKLDAFELKD